jgi:glucose-1-phosphate adenylyltransferase
MRKNVVCLILGGGRGTRLFPLTEHRSKPAVPLAGNYRLIDIPISNCLNCNINRIYVLTQFNSVSLHRHIRQTYRFDRFSNGFMVLSGDQLYRMDFDAMLENHLAAGADASIAALPVTDEDAKGFGVMRIDDAGRVHGFLEKPQTTKEMDMVRMDPAWIDQQGIPSKGRSLLASMGIYLFNRDCLVELLEKNDYTDFGKEVFPLSIRARKVHVNLFDGYWEDIGTIKAFYDANLALAGEAPPFNLIDEQNPIFTRARALAPARILDATVRQSLIAPGSFIETNALIENSIVGLRCHVGNSASIRSSIIMGNDFYEDQDDASSSDLPPVGIGEGSVVEGAIVDKNVRIGRNCKVRLRPGIEADCDINGVHIRDGIIVVPKGAVLPDGWEL